MDLSKPFKAKDALWNNTFKEAATASFRQKMNCPYCDHQIVEGFYCIQCGHVPPKEVRSGRQGTENG